MATVVALHAHPDDETLLTGGTLARLARQGHRVVLVTATAGEAGLSDATPDDLGRLRLGELHAAARILGVARVVALGYPDSGSDPHAARPPGCFAELVPEDPAGRVVAVLGEEGADLLLGYDAHGGYGHPDHVQVHRVARLASRQTGVRLLEATVDRDLLGRWCRVGERLPRVRALLPTDRFAACFTPHRELTHRVDVRPQVRLKQAALAAHASQTTGADVRTVRLLSRLPGPVANAVLGREWFSETGRVPGRTLVDDVLA